MNSDEFWEALRDLRDGIQTYSKCSCNYIKTDIIRGIWNVAGHLRVRIAGEILAKSEGAQLRSTVTRWEAVVEKLLLRVDDLEKLAARSTTARPPGNDPDKAIGCV